jgi:hypothetical protein
MASQILCGLNEISTFTGLGENLLRQLIRTAKFPARKTDLDGGGIWISSAEAIDRWALSFANSGIAANLKENRDDEQG